MELIQNNPYRVAGILSNATEREFQRNKSRFLKFASVEKEIKSDYDFIILSEIKRTEDLIKKAFSAIEQNHDKVNYALFWFSNMSPFDNTAIDYLKNGNKEKALEIWEKTTNGKDVNSKNFSAFNNLGTYKLLSLNKNDIKIGIEIKIKLVQSEYFESFVHSVTDQTITIDNEKQSEKLIDEMLIEFKNQYSISETLKLFSNCNGTIQEYLSKKFTEEPLHKIETQVENCKKKRKANKSSAYKYGLKLFKNTKEDLSLLKSLLGNANFKYKTIADQLANEIMQCGIDYFNKSQENYSEENYIEQAQKLTKIANKIAIGKLTRDRVKDSLETLEEMKDQEINQAIALLKSIKLAYDKAISEINAEVSSMRMTMSYNQSINYTKVDKMKENCLDWSKIVEVVKNDISPNDVIIIKNCLNQNKVDEYRNLVDFLFSKIGPIQINKIKHLCYWKDIRASQAKSAAKKIGRTTINTATAANDASGGCLGEIFARFVGIIILFIIIGILSAIFG